MAREGMIATDTPEGADLIILNTCHIREKAAEKVYSELGRMRILKQEAAEQDRRVTIAVAGCVAQAEGAEILRRAPAVDLVVGSQSYHKLPELLARAVNEPVVETEFPVEDKFDYLAPPSKQAIRARGVSAFVTVQEGCDKFCTFCVVPYTRGAEVSRPVAKIVADAKRLASAGVREITLIGQNVNAYHGDGPDGRPASLAKLLYAIADIPGIARLRYTTSHPRDMSDDLIAAHRDLAALMPQLHLPVQSGSDRILAAMNRKHTHADYLGVIARLRDACPDIALTSDFIVGFPGETEEDFRDTLQANRCCEIFRHLLFQVFRASRHAGGRAWRADFGGRKVRASGAAAGCGRARPPGVQRALVAARHLTCCSKSRAALPGQLVGRSPHLADGASDGAGKSDRPNRAGDDYGHWNQHPVRRPGVECQGKIGASSRNAASLNAPRGSDNGIALKPEEGAGATQIVLAFDDNRLASGLFGQYSQNFALIERRLGVTADQRGNHLTLEGSRDGCEQARRVLEGLYDQLKRGGEVTEGDVEGAIRLAIAQGSLFDYDSETSRPPSEEINLRKRPVRARTAAQEAYIRALKRHALVFGTGPAGTGKTWLAVAYAVLLVRAQGSRPHRVVASRGRSRRAAGLLAGRHARKGRSVSAPDLRRAVTI